jgi:hypothetical protein
LIQELEFRGRADFRRRRLHARHRIDREVKINAIGGGTEEIMKDLASRQTGL